MATKRREGGREGGKEAYLPKHATGEVVVLEGQTSVPDSGHSARIDGIGAMLLYKQAQGRVSQGLEGGREGGREEEVYVSDGGHAAAQTGPGQGQSGPGGREGGREG
jgi:hypothetical protein